MSPLIAACSSLASVGKLMFLGCTAVSTLTGARSRVRSAPLACATRRLSAKSSYSLSPNRSPDAVVACFFGRIARHFAPSARARESRLQIRGNLES